MLRTKNKLIKILVFLLLLFWYSLFFAHKIDLTTADLGRHLQNGNILINGSVQDRQAVLTTNFYSSTLPQGGFINHHWLSGVVFYLVQKAAGFGGVSIVYLLFALGSFVLYFDVARRKSNFWMSTVLSIMILPLVVKRVEVRPEVFSYFLTGLFLWILVYVKNNPYKKLLWVLPVLMLIWVNLHIGFVFGFLVLGSFGIEQLILLLGKKPNQFWQIFKVSLVCLLAACINPHFVRGLIYPLQIFSNYGYLIVENQSIGFLENLKFVNGQHFVLFRIMLFLAVGSITVLGIKNWRRIDIPLTNPVLVSGAMAYQSIRSFPVFAYFALSAIAYHLYQIPKKPIQAMYKYYLWTLGIVIVIFCLAGQFQDLSLIKPVLGFGLMPGVDASAEFYKNHKIKGPIFNNYDIGGYLIYHLYPEKVFVDNRPEAYTGEFFKNTYIASQEDSRKFEELDNKYRFNVIFFSHRDYTPWGQTFLIARVKDKAWAPVFVDNYNIIFLKRNEQNADLIKKYELPPDKFSVKSN